MPSQLNHFPLPVSQRKTPAFSGLLIKVAHLAYFFAEEIHTAAKKLGVSWPEAIVTGTFFLQQGCLSREKASQVSHLSKNYL